MKLSIVVVFHNMSREAVRTLHSLSPAYQNVVSCEDYEVIAIDNGSDVPLDLDLVRNAGPNFSGFRREATGVSPVEAVSLGVDKARGDAIAVIVDGARMATPGLVSMTLLGLELHDDPFVSSLSWHLGPDIQGKSMLNGYDQPEEDRLLSSIGWPKDGYRLFEIATLAPSSGVGFLGGVPSECSWFAMSRSGFLSMGGFDPRFKSPGGGRMNHDFRNRAVSLPNMQSVILLGEGVFHQFHGGVTTNVTVADRDRLRKTFWDEYYEIRGKDAKPPSAPTPLYIGQFPKSARAFVRP
jgi:glycosyltransferase involved in cell wall biosynthesis